LGGTLEHRLHIVIGLCSGGRISIRFIEKARIVIKLLLSFLILKRPLAARVSAGAGFY